MPEAVILAAVRTPVGRDGVATMCVGVGQGQAAHIERA
jgi:acetyl-CoA acetyltransferase